MRCDVEGWQHRCGRGVPQLTGIHIQRGGFVDAAGQMGRAVTAVIGMVPLAVGVGVRFGRKLFQGHCIMPGQRLGMGVPGQRRAGAEIGHQQQTEQ